MTDEFRMSKLDIINNDLKQKRIWIRKRNGGSVIGKRVTPEDHNTDWGGCFRYSQSNREVTKTKKWLDLTFSEWKNKKRERKVYR